jgi:hypothetical protein
VSGIPKPNVSALESVFEKLSDLKVKEAKEQIKAQASGSNSRRGRGRGRSGGRNTP